MTEYFCPIMHICPERQWLGICKQLGCQHPEALEIRAEKSKPRVRAIARLRLLGQGIPDDAEPGDLIIGNRGAAAIVGVSCRGTVLIAEYAGNVYRATWLTEGRRKIYDYRI